MSNRIFFSFTKAIGNSHIYSRCLCYKSKLSLENIYPNNGMKKTFEPPESQSEKFTGFIPIKELKITSMNSSGPGGQNVNKVETKVDIRFHVQSANWLSESTKQKLTNKYFTRINKEGYFIVRSEKTKSKIINIADALNYIRELIFNLEEPSPEVKPETLEKHRKNKEKSVRNRLMEKRFISLRKQAKKQLDII